MDIRIFVMDVDGTLTDGKIYIGNDGEIFKAFNIKDGLGIKLLIKNGILPVIITGRKSKITENRCRELGISEIYQGIEDKVKCLENIMKKQNVTLENIAFIGDDINDSECLNLCGISACPNDAAVKVKSIVDFISKNNGGEGAVREFADYVIYQNRNVEE